MIDGSARPLAHRAHEVFFRWAARRAWWCGCSRSARNAGREPGTGTASFSRNNFHGLSCSRVHRLACSCSPLGTHRPHSQVNARRAESRRPQARQKRRPRADPRSVLRGDDQRASLASGVYQPATLKAPRGRRSETLCRCAGRPDLCKSGRLVQRIRSSPGAMVAVGVLGCGAEAASSRSRRAEAPENRLTFLVRDSYIRALTCSTGYRLPTG